MKYVVIFIVLVLFVISLQYLGGYVIYHSFEGWPERGTFGDMFGAVNTFFSGLAFAGILYAIFLQHKELSLQRRELELTREELKRSSEAQEKSALALTEQASALLQTARLNSINLIPSLIMETAFESDKILYRLMNIGNTAAFNVDIIALGLYSSEEITPEDFVNQYTTGHPADVDRILKTNDGIYGVFDHLCYAVVPQRRKVTCCLNLPRAPFNMYVLLQFYDMQGHNYHQIYWFIDKSGKKEPPLYIVGSIDPMITSSGARIIYDDELALKTEDNSDIPDYIRKNFAVHWPFSIPSGYIDFRLHDVEGRGVWEEYKMT